MESQAPVADLGLVDVMAGTIAFEKLHVPGDVTVQDLVLDGDRPWTLVTTDPDVPNAHVTTARWLDPTGAYAAASRHVADDYNVNLAWMPSRKQIAADVSCDVDLLDLPPP